MVKLSYTCTHTVSLTPATHWLGPCIILSNMGPTQLSKQLPQGVHVHCEHHIELVLWENKEFMPTRLAV